jgi:hypothetical protein
VTHVASNCNQYCGIIEVDMMLTFKAVFIHHLLTSAFQMVKLVVAEYTKTGIVLNLWVPQFWLQRKLASRQFQHRYRRPL